jgi:hypothetical protein
LNLPTATQLPRPTPDDRLFEYDREALYDEQFAAMFDERRYSCTEATTKSGKTSAGIIWLGEQALAGTAGRNYWWVAPIFSQAKIAFDRMCDAVTREIRRPNINELRIDMVNGTRIWFKSGDQPDSLYGEDVYAAVVDEASRMKEAAWHAVRSTLTATRGAVRLIGNVHGRKNWFYKMCRRAEAGDRNMGYHKITWKHAVAAGVLQLAEIEDARAQLPPNVFRELYEAEAGDDEGNPFGIDAIRACRMEKFSLDPVLCWGWDLGKRHDWTAGVALDRRGRMVHFERFQAPWGDTKRRIIEATKGNRALVDATGVGDSIVEDLARASGNFTGFVFTQRSKQDLMELLQSEIQQKRLGLTGDVLLNELESFEYEYKGRDGRFTGVYYSAPPGLYDDCVCALALAARHRGPSNSEFRFSRVPNMVQASGIDAAEAPDDGKQGEPRFERTGPGWENQTGMI